jgi:hypothetical protein
LPAPNQGRRSASVRVDLLGRVEPGEVAERPAAFTDGLVAPSLVEGDGWPKAGVTERVLDAYTAGASSYRSQQVTGHREQPL